MGQRDKWAPDDAGFQEGWLKLTSWVKVKFQSKEACGHCKTTFTTILLDHKMGELRGSYPLNPSIDCVIPRCSVKKGEEVPRSFLGACEAMHCARYRGARGGDVDPWHQSSSSCNCIIKQSYRQ